jgi:hypothetical protein
MALDGKYTRRINQHLAAIGRVAATWSEFEAIIDVSAISLARIPHNAGYCFAAQVIGPARKLDAYIALARLRGGASFVGELERFTRDATSMAERRNRVVHDSWLLIGRENPHRLEITAKRVLRHQYVEVPTAKVLALADEIAALTERFTSLHDRISEAVGTSRGTPP